MIYDMNERVLRFFHFSVIEYQYSLEQMKKKICIELSGKTFHVKRIISIHFLYIKTSILIQSNCLNDSPIFFLFIFPFLLSLVHTKQREY